MTLLAIVAQSIVAGVVAMLLWILLWSSTFADVWPGYDAHTERVLFVVAIGYGISYAATALYRLK